MRTLNESYPILDCTVNKCHGKFFVDTGSSMTLMRRSFCDRIIREGGIDIHEIVKMITNALLESQRARLTLQCYATSSLHLLSTRLCMNFTSSKAICHFLWTLGGFWDRMM